MCEDSPNTPQKQEEIDTIVQSTKKIAEQVNEIMGQKSESVSLALIENPPDAEPLAEGQEIAPNEGEINNGPTIGQLTTAHSHPSARERELEAENEELKAQLIDTIEKNLRLEDENKALREELEGERGERGELINSLSSQLERLKNNSSIKTNASYTEQA